MKDLLFISSHQFGYLIDTYEYCKYLNRFYKITILCYDKGYSKQTIENVKVIYVNHSRLKIFRIILFLIKAVFLSLINKGFIFVVYFPHVGILKKILFWKKMHLDIRSLSVSPDVTQRISFNNDLFRSVTLFDSVSAISKGVINKIPSAKYISLLPLGADIFSKTKKKYEKLNILYVGTLYNRNIIKTVIAFDRFKKNHPEITMHYDIVGDGGKEFDEIKNYIETNSIDDSITMHGRIIHDELKPFFDKCNIGVSFVPITDYYDNQPPTKTFEYVLSGIYTIGTATTANREIINDLNGCLVEDTINDFLSALENIVLIRDRFDSDIIRASLCDFTWKNIIDNYLIPILERYETK